MIPQEFLYFLVDEQGNSYYLNNGVVDKTSTPTPVDHAPDGWMSTSIKWARNIERYFGAIRSFTTPYKFVKNASKIIRSRYYRYGRNDRLYMVLLWLDKSFGGGWVHRQLFKGRIDLAQFKNERSTNIVEVPIVEGDLYKLFKANETTVYPIPITGPMVYDDGITLKETGTLQVIDGVQMVFAGPGGGDLQVVNVPLIVNGTEGKSSGIVFINQELDSSVDTNFAQASSGNSGPVALHLKGDLFFRVDETSRGVLQLSFRKATETSLGGGVLVFNSSVSAGTNYSCSFDITIAMNPGDKLTLDAYAFGTGPFKMIFRSNSKFLGFFSNRYKLSYTPVMRPVELLQELFKKCTGSILYIVKSDYLSNVWDNLTITSGDAIRGIANPVIKISIQQLFDSLNVPCNLSMRISGRFVYIEPKASAFDPTVVMDLGEVKDLDVSEDEDFQYNKLSIGYPDLDQSTYEGLNAREEFNVTSRFTTNDDSKDNELNLVSFIHASMYEQELARANLDGKDTTAASVDETVFFKHIEKVSTALTTDGLPAYRYLRPTFDSITGLSFPADAYNILISPMRCLLAQGNFIRSIFHWQEMSNLVYQFSDQQTTLKTVKGAVTIDERASPNIGSLDAPLFVPMKFDFTAPMKRELIGVMKTTPNGTFSFLWRGDIHYGFVKEIGIQPAKRPAQQSTLICSPQTDILKFI